MAANIGIRIREFAGAFIIFSLLSLIFGLYFLKYIPAQRSNFHRNAFLELSQLENALQERNKGYRDAIHNFIIEKNIDSAALLKFFNYRSENSQSLFSGKTQKKGIDTFSFGIGPTIFEQDELSRVWQMRYLVYRNDNLPVGSLSKNVDTLMSLLISTYKDIFDSYLLIRENQVHPHNDSRESEETPRGEIIYKSGDLSIDYQVNSDSLMKKNDGFSLLNVHDVTIEGNPYKLFLYPFEIGKQRLILAGLISQENYKDAYQKIPFNFIALIGVLILLLLIHMPILKIYMLSSHERIRDLDIRMIIGSYFIAAFVGFFLFSKVFLDQEQKIQNHAHLEILSERIIDSLDSELTTIDEQLKIFDQKFDSLCHLKDSFLLSMVIDTGIESYTNHLDSLFKPRVYPYLDNIFWIGSDGKWKARWAFKRVFNRSPMIDVKDRQYFKDFQFHQALLLQGRAKDSFAIQPTLSKLDGEYIITVVRKSNKLKDTLLELKNRHANVNPYLIGLGAEMHSVSHVLLPPGYGFSIIDEQGAIKFDSKPGRPLLSNMLKEIDDPSGVQQTARYRSRRYFNNIMLRGKTVVLLSRPINGLPYQLLVYYNLFRSDGFEEHLIGLSALLTGCVLVLLLFCGLINQLSKKRLRLLESHSQHFDWLHPSKIKLKRNYYLHLINWMLILLLIYILAWVIIEAFSPRTEFSLLFISLLFPFYVAVHYYELRERFYDLHENREGIIWYFARPTPQLRALLLIIILLINCYACIGGFSWSRALPVLITQFIWLTAAGYSIFSFRKYRGSDNLRGGQDSVSKLLKPYIWAILTGVILISIIPASGIFWLMLRQETSLDFNSDQLILARQIDQRRLEINYRLPDYKFNTNDTSDLLSIQKLKFFYGIYMLSGQSVGTDSAIKNKPPHYPAAEYIQLHRRFFPEDSLILAWAEPPDSAADGTWHFWMDKSDRLHNPQLIYRDQRDGINKNPFRLKGDSSGAWNAAQFMGHETFRTGALYSIIYFGSLGLSLVLAYFLTRSLTRRIFLLDLYEDGKWNEYKNSYPDKLLRQYANCRALRILIYKSYKNKEMYSGVSGKHAGYFLSNSFPSIKDIYFFEKNLSKRSLEERILTIAKLMAPVYTAIWKNLSQSEKFILYDFALDGFANYKTEKILRQLLEKGLIFFDDLRLTAMTTSFQEYVLHMKKDPDITAFMTKASKEDSWKKFKVPLLLVLAGIGIFIFITQDAIYQKITGLLTSISSLLPLLTGLFNKENGKSEK